MNKQVNILLKVIAIIPLLFFTTTCSHKHKGLVKVKVNKEKGAGAVLLHTQQPILIGKMESHQVFPIIIDRQNVVPTSKASFSKPKVYTSYQATKGLASKVSLKTNPKSPPDGQNEPSSKRGSNAGLTILLIGVLLSILGSIMVNAAQNANRIDSNAFYNGCLGVLFIVSGITTSLVGLILALVL